MSSRSDVAKVCWPVTPHGLQRNLFICLLNCEKVPRWKRPESISVVTKGVGKMTNETKQEDTAGVTDQSDHSVCGGVCSSVGVF